MVHALLAHFLQYLTDEIPAGTFQLNYLPGRDVIVKDGGDSIYITLLNITEDVSAKMPYVYHQDANQKFSRQNPPLMLDLCIMISAFYGVYEEGLKAISAVIQTLAGRRKFNTGVMGYTVSMYNISMEQNSSLWQALSTNVLPNVVYKIRFISVEPALNEEADLAGEIIEINVKTSGL